jgi:hypothetical protein
MHNYNTLMGIIAGLNTSYVSRLRQALLGVPQKTLQVRKRGKRKEEDGEGGRR